MSYPIAERPLWVPDAGRIAAANITAFARKAESRWGRSLPDYAALHAWSVGEPAEFWTSVWEFGEVRGRWAGWFSRMEIACPVLAGFRRRV